MSGVLVAVVGPSGAGKDTLMDAARAVLDQDERITFLRRAVTRPVGAGGEDHLPFARDAFLRARDTGAFALWWEAHGLFYGLPRATLEEALASGRVAVANLSRRVLGEAAARHRLRVLEITASPSILAARLADRGRESATDVAERLSRQVSLPAGLPVETVVNDGSVEEAAEQVVRVLRGGWA